VRLQRPRPEDIRRQRRRDTPDRHRVPEQQPAVRVEEAVPPRPGLKTETGLHRCTRTDPAGT
jgi:hypothetical protein